MKYIVFTAVAAFVFYIFYTEITGTIKINDCKERIAYLQDERACVFIDVINGITTGDTTLEKNSQAKYDSLNVLMSLEFKNWDTAIAKKHPICNYFFGE